MSSCNDQAAGPGRGPANPTSYFNLSAFIAEQVKQLQTARVVVEKTVANPPDAPEIKVLRTINWAQELETFTQADINKPALRAAYAVNTANTADGQIKTTYRKKPGNRDASIEYLEVTISPANQVSQIAGRYREDNYLVASAKSFSLRCAPVNGQNRIITYEISGTQKTVFFDPLRYSVQSKIR